MAGVRYYPKKGHFLFCLAQEECVALHKCHLNTKDICVLSQSYCVDSHADLFRD